MTAVESPVAAPVARPSEGGRISTLAGMIKNLVIGTLMCMTPVTAIIALGWMLRYMRLVSLRRLDPDRDATDKTGWILGPRGAGFPKRVLGGAWLNLRTGFGSFVSLALATLPFTGLWLGSWWAGWENSFNKGYEQFWVGPTLGLTGVAIGLWVMAHLPMALAHQAVEGRPFALFEVRRVRRLIAAAGWRYVVLAGLIVFAALPLFAARGLPAFVEGIIPGFSELPADRIENLAGLIALVKAGYIFVSLVILRGWTAGLYARAAERIRLGGEPDLWSGSAIERSAKGLWPSEPAKRPWLLFRFMRFALLLAIWFGLVVQIYIGQFLNQNWWYWVNHPYLVLPWSV